MDPLSELRRSSPRLAEALPGLMRRAIELGSQAKAPFGCVIADVESGQLVVDAGNTTGDDPTAHAEMNAIRAMAQKGMRADRLALVTTAEPCPMCAGACWWAGFPVVVFGTSIPSLMAMGWRQVDLSMAELLSRARPPASCRLIGGFLAEETDPLYRAGPRAST